MMYITDNTEFQIEEATVVTLGKFDGRHRGHQKLFHEMEAIKKETGLASAVFTFRIAPASMIAGRAQPVITTNRERRSQLEKMGVDYLVEYPFDENVRHMAPETFVKEILVKQMGAKAVVVGTDCSFGYLGEGNAELLEKLSGPLGYRLRVVEKEKDDLRDISSTYIREELAKGNVAKANELLGEPYAIHGTVVHGNHIGGPVLGFPTANLVPPPEKLLPRFGVYVSRVLVDGHFYKGITNIGKKPTVSGKHETGAETYLFGTEEDLYGKWMEVQLLEFEREECKFSSLEELKEQIEKDKTFAEEWFKRHPEIWQNF